MEAIEIFKELREVLKEIFGVNIPDRVMADVDELHKMLSSSIKTLKSE